MTLGFLGRAMSCGLSPGHGLNGCASAGRPAVRELLHVGHPSACLEDAAFGCVDAFSTHLNVDFFHGAALDDPAGFLEGAGKRMRHVKLRRTRQVNTEALSDLIATPSGTSGCASNPKEPEPRMSPAWCSPCRRASWRPRKSGPRMARNSSKTMDGWRSSSAGKTTFPTTNRPTSAARSPRTTARRSSSPGRSGLTKCALKAPKKRCTRTSAWIRPAIRRSTLDASSSAASSRCSRWAGLFFATRR